jgi:hypothetical protein
LYRDAQLFLARVNWAHFSRREGGECIKQHVLQGGPACIQ